MENNEPWQTTSPGRAHRLRDYARVGQFMLQRGLWCGQQLLPEDWVVRATVSSREKVQPRLYPGYALGYQYQWWTFPADDLSNTAEGFNGQFLYVNPAEQLMVVITSAWLRFWDSALEAEFYATIDALIELTESP